MAKLEITDFVEEIGKDKVRITQSVVANTGEGFGIPYKQGEIVYGSGINNLRGYLLMNRIERA